MVTMAGYAEGPAEMAEHISLKGLVSQCVDLAQRAGELIRAVSDNKSECGIGAANLAAGVILMMCWVMLGHFHQDLCISLFVVWMNYNIYNDLTSWRHWNDGK